MYSPFIILNYLFKISGIQFIKNSKKDINKKLFLLLDNLAVHHSKEFRNWLKKHESTIEVFYLPPYSPELNPDERLNRDLKTHFHSGPTVKNRKQLENKTKSVLRNIQKNPARVEKYFDSDFVRYAA